MLLKYLLILGLSSFYEDGDWLGWCCRCGGTLVAFSSPLSVPRVSPAPFLPRLLLSGSPLRPNRLRVGFFRSPAEAKPQRRRLFPFCRLPPLLPPLPPHPRHSSPEGPRAALSQLPLPLPPRHFLFRFSRSPRSFRCSSPRRKVALTTTLASPSSKTRVPCLPSYDLPLHRMATGDRVLCCCPKHWAVPVRGLVRFLGILFCGVFIDSVAILVQPMECFGIKYCCFLCS